MADLDFTSLALPYSSAILPVAFSSRLFCCRCASTSIPMPPGATPRTTYTCRRCCDALRRERDREVTTLLAELGASVDARFSRQSFAGDTGDIFTRREE